MIPMSVGSVSRNTEIKFIGLTVEQVVHGSEPYSVYTVIKDGDVTHKYYVSFDSKIDFVGGILIKKFKPGITMYKDWLLILN